MKLDNCGLKPQLLLGLGLLLWLSAVRGQQTPPDVAEQCPAQLDTDDVSGFSVFWPAVNRSTPPQIVSNIQPSPLCLDGERFLLARNCSPLNGWQPATGPRCVYTQQSYAAAERCPPQFVTISAGSTAVCVRLTAPQRWNNACLASGGTHTVLDLKADKRALVFEHLQQLQVDRIWMPARRRDRFGPVAWTLPGRGYGDSVEFEDLGIEIEQSALVAEHGCLSLSVSSSGSRGSMEDCGQEYPILCVFDDGDDDDGSSRMLQLACPSGFMTTRYAGHQDRCYGTQRMDLGRAVAPRQMANTSQYTWLESQCRGKLYSLDNPEKTTLFEHFTRRESLSASDRCLIGVLPNTLAENRTHWQSLLAAVSFVNWAQPMNWWPPERRTNVVAADRLGSWHWSQDFSCIACERQVRMRKPHIELKFYESRLFAVVYNREFLWRERSSEAGFKCFTDADSELVRTVRIEGEVWSGNFEDDRVSQSGDIRDKSRTVYELRTYGDGPGYYWCEGHAIPDFVAVRAAPVVAHKHLKGIVFAVMVRTSCRECGLYFQDRRLKEMARRFRVVLNHLRRAARRQSAQSEEISIENVRVMKIHEIDVPRNFSDILFHVTVAFDDDELDDSEEDQLQLSTEAIRIYKMRNHLQRLLLPTVTNRTAEFRYLGLNSTEFCLPRSISAAADLHWVSARIGETAAPKELCMQANGLPVRRRCVGDFIYGGTWHNETSQPPKCADDRLSPITRSLYEIDRTFRAAHETSAIIANVTGLIQSTAYERLIPADLYYLGRVMQTIIRFNELSGGAGGDVAVASGNNGTTTSSTTTTPTSPTTLTSPTSPTTLLKRTESESIFTIYNRLMFLSENTTRLSAALNSTNVLLEALDNVVNRLSPESLMVRTLQVNLTENKVHGTIAMISANLMVYVLDPSVRNFSGIALRRRLDAVEPPLNFYDYEVELLGTDQSAAELLHDERLEAAAFVPESLLRRLSETRHMVVATNSSTSIPSFIADVPPPVSIVVTIYYNDLLFQEYRRTTHAKPGGKIISVSIPGYGPILPDLLPIFVRTDRFDADVDTADVCGYWNFQTNTWSSDGCEFGGMSSVAAGNDSTTIMCACSHLTHFAYLIMGTYFHSFSGDDDVAAVVMDNHQEALDLITLLGCSLSLAGIFGICITALVFPAWREKANSKVLLHLSAAIGLQMILLCFVNTEVRSMNFFVNQQWHGCVTMGAMLHYSVLVAFNWMLITAYLQFMRYVRVIGHQRSTRFLLKAALVGWGLPLIPVGIVVAITPHSYIPDMLFVGQGICYPNGYALYFGVILPMGVIVLANLVIFVLVIYNIVRGPDGKLRTANERALTLDQLRVSVLLFFLLGLTWIFGFCASTHAGLVFSYLFCLTATLQGFVLFLYFVILDPVTRKLWSKWLKRYLGCGAEGGDDLK